jgi:hypothetical protein
MLLPYLFKPGAIAIAFLAFSSVVMAMLRARKLPQCFACGAMKVRPARPDGVGDSALGLLLIRPHRCEGCRERFYAVRLQSGSRQRLTHDRSEQQPGKQRAVALVFRRRNGVLDRVAIRMVDLEQPARSQAYRRLEPESRNQGSLSGGPAVLQA